MNIWQKEILKIVNLVFGNAGKATDLEIAVCLIAAILGTVLILKWTAKSFGASMADNGRIFTVIGTGILLALVVTAASNIYIIPHIKNAMVIKWMPLASCAIILFVIVTPLSCFLLKAKYFPMLFAGLSSIFAAIGIVMLVHGAFGAIKQGDKEFKKTRERTENVNDMMKK
jgi:hypothetical protein